MKVNEVLGEAEEFEREPVTYSTVNKLIRQGYAKDEDATEFRDMLRHLEQIRQPMDRIYKQIQRYLVPESGSFDKVYTQSNDEYFDINQDFILDSTPRHSLQKAVNGLHGGLTPPSYPWFTFAIGSYTNESEQVSRPVKEYLETVQNGVRDLLSISNFYSEIAPWYKDLIAFGTACMLQYADYGTGTRFMNLPCGTYYLNQDSRQNINMMYYRFRMTATEIVKEYGEENAPTEIVKLVKKKGGNRSFSVIQCIQPWNMFGQGSDSTQYEWEDVRFVENIESKEDRRRILYRKGYTSKPFTAVRWTDTTGYVYSRFSPGMMSLPDNKQLQLAADHFNQASAWSIDPAWLADVSIKKDVEKNGFHPGRIYYGNNQSQRPIITPLFQPQFDYNPNLQQRADLREMQNRAFFNDVLMSISSQSKNMTATEIVQRQAEAAAVLGPIVYQLMSKGLSNFLDRTYDIGSYVLRLFPEPPPEIVGERLEPYFTSILASQQRQASVAGVMPFLQYAGALAQLQPQTIQSIDGDAALRYGVEQYNAPVGILRPEDEIQAEREAQAQAQQQAQQMQAIQTMSGAAKNLGQASVTEDNALGMLAAEGGGVEALTGGV